MTRSGPTVDELLAAITRELILVSGDRPSRLAWLQLWVAAQAARPEGFRRSRNTRKAFERRRLRSQMQACWACGHYRWCGLHHILPIGRGGTNDPRNLLRLCRSCHMALHPLVGSLEQAS